MRLLTPSLRLGFSAALATLWTLAAPAALAKGPTSDLSKVVLTTELVSTTCTITSPGHTIVVPCSNTGWNPLLHPGWTATMTATYSYQYRDDGLPLTSPFAFQLDPFGLRMQPATHESAAIYGRSSGDCANTRAGCPPTFSQTSSTFGPVFMSNDQTPTQDSGTFAVSTSTTLSTSWPTTLAPTMWVSTFAMTAPAVAAIPEPSTYALMLSALGLIALARRRQRQAALALRSRFA